MSCSDNRLDLVPLVSSPSWKLDRDNLWRLPRAHCEEVVRSVCLDEQVRFSRFFLYVLSMLLFWLSLFITIANPIISSIRVNQFSLVVRMALCERGGLLRRVRHQSSLSRSPGLGLGLRRLARRRRRRTGSSHTSLCTAGECICYWQLPVVYHWVFRW